ncbi:MAG: glycosyltransferase family 1 protein [Planctomycetota bacterium]
MNAHIEARSRHPRPLRIGLDARPALVNREGIGRYTRELVRALLAAEGDEELRLFGATLAPARAEDAELGLPHPRAKLRRWRVPSKLVARGLALTRLGVDDLLGGCDLFHHTQPNVLRVRRAPQVLTIFDALFVADAEGRTREGGPAPGWVEPETARRMTDTLRAAAARADLVLTGCEWVARDIVDALGVDPARVRVTYLGCDHLPILPRAEPSQRYLLTVARVDPRKNHLGVLRAFEALVREGRDLRWVIAGPVGWRCEAVEAALAASPARARIEWRRAVSERELCELYAGAALFMWPSYAEGYGLPPLEAMRAGVPVVASDRTTLPEVLGEGALLVDPDDDAALLHAARTLLDDDAARAALIARGHTRAAALSWSRCARETLAAYRSCYRSERHSARR